MPLVINTNVMSLNAQRNISGSNDALATSLQRLSSGLRINSAKDDAAGLFVSEQMTADIRGLNQAARNAADGISLAQTAEGAMAEIANSMQRIREIAVQSANATVGDRAGLAAEATELVNEITRVIADVEFNGTALLSGAATLTFQVGQDNGDTIDVSTADLTALDTAMQAVNVSTSAGAAAALTSIDTQLDSLSTTRATFGAVQNRFESVIANITNYSENLEAARSRVRDTDFAAETANLTKTQILQQAGISMLSQANTAPQNVLALLQ